MKRRGFLLKCTGAASLIGFQTSAASQHSPSSLYGRRIAASQSFPKLSLSTDYGAPDHWERVIEYARRHDVSRLVYWGLDSEDPFFYPKYPKLLSENQNTAVQQSRGWLRGAAEKTNQAGIEFWFVFQVLQLPVERNVKRVWNRPALDYLRGRLPGIFNLQGEPDMNADAVYEFICNQLDEVRNLAPQLCGIELWVMEGASVQIASLAHQQLSIEAICGRIIGSVHNHLSNTGVKLDVDLHTAGGDPRTRGGLLQAAKQYGDVIISADNVIGDFNPFLPFNKYLAEAASSNPVAVHFDLNGEYWGRNFVPTSALTQYAVDIEDARNLHPAYIDGRVSTLHDTWSPHCNVLPSRRKFYPQLTKISTSSPLPPNLKITSTDTLGCFNADFFCRRVRDPQSQPEDAVRDFLCQQFGGGATALLPALLRLEQTLGNMFFADCNYYGFQSILPDSGDMELGYLSTQMTLAEGTEFPTRQIRSVIMGRTGYKFAFAGWPTPTGHLCSGTGAIVFDKQQGLEQAGEILREVRKGVSGLSLSDGDFLNRLFEDLFYLAEIRRLLLEAQAHFYLIRNGERADGLPNARRLRDLLGNLQQCDYRWKARYPGGRYLVSERLQPWLETMRRT